MFYVWSLYGGVKVMFPEVSACGVKTEESPFIDLVN